MIRRTHFLILAVAFLGCGGRSYKVAPVAGTVTLDGKPLAGVHVTFVPLGSKDNVNPGPGSHGLTDNSGHFELVTTTGELGAVVGKHQISIESPQEGETRSDQPDGAESEEMMRKRIERRETIPPRYNRDTEITFDVPPGGTKQANLDLSGK